MFNKSIHPTDQELLLAADGELPVRRVSQIRAHLAACWDCRARMAETEGTIADFTRTYRQILDPQLPPVAGPRALLKAQLAEQAGKRDPKMWFTFFQFTPAMGAAVYISAALLLVSAIGALLFQHSSARNAKMAASSFEIGIIPNRNLTPGVARIVAISDVCSMPHEEVVRDVPKSVRQVVFQEYGIRKAHTEDYEIDYLIAPGLGGVGDIHNLWPEPYSSSPWNAHVKDALEEHLHQMVCAGKLDLPTAQRDIATDWIAAYKKYFHTDEPLALGLDVIRIGGLSFVSFVSFGVPVKDASHPRNPAAVGLETLDFTRLATIIALS